MIDMASKFCLFFFFFLPAVPLLHSYILYSIGSPCAQIAHNATSKYCVQELKGTFVSLTLAL